MKCTHKNVVYICFSLLLMFGSLQALSSINLSSYVKPIHVNTKGLVNSPTGPPWPGSELSLGTVSVIGDVKDYPGYYENPDGRMLL